MDVTLINFEPTAIDLKSEVGEQIINTLKDYFNHVEEGNIDAAFDITFSTEAANIRQRIFYESYPNSMNGFEIHGINQINENLFVTSGIIYRFDERREFNPFLVLTENNEWRIAFNSLVIPIQYTSNLVIGAELPEGNLGDGSGGDVYFFIVSCHIV